MTPQPCEQLPAKTRKSMHRRCCILVDVLESILDIHLFDSSPANYSSIT